MNHIKGLLANLRECHSTVLLQFLLGTSRLHPLINVHLHIAVDSLCWHVDGVNLCLMEEEFLQGEVLRYRTVGIAGDARHLLTSFLHVATEDGCIAHYPDHLIDDIVQLCSRCQLQRRQGHSPCISEFHHQWLFTVSKTSL